MPKTFVFPLVQPPPITNMDYSYRAVQWQLKIRYECDKVEGTWVYLEVCNWRDKQAYPTFCRD